MEGLMNELVTRLTIESLEQAMYAVGFLTIYIVFKWGMWADSGQKFDWFYAQEWLYSALFMLMIGGFTVVGPNTEWLAAGFMGLVAGFAAVFAGEGFRKLMVPQVSEEKSLARKLEKEIKKIGIDDVIDLANKIKLKI